MLIGYMRVSTTDRQSTDLQRDALILEAILEAIRESGRAALAVSNGNILAAQRQTSELEGCSICPEGAAAVHAAGVLRAAGWITD